MPAQQSEFAVVANGPMTLPPWLYRIPLIRTLVAELGVTEFRRRLLHMSPALLPMGLPLTPHEDVWESWLMGSALIFTLLGVMTALLLAPLFTRAGEENWIGTVMGYFVPPLGALFLFPGRAELALMALQIVALGDGSAVLGGKLLGGWQLPWNSGKTVSGLLCFIGVSSLSATYAYWGEARPAVSVSTAFLICGVAAICAGIVESLPLRSPDNLRVGMTALLSGGAMTLWLA